MSFYDPTLFENANASKYLQDNHWEPTAEVTINQTGQVGEQNLGAAVATGATRRIREITVRHDGTNATVITLKVAGVGGRVVLTFDVPAQTTRVWSSEDGRVFQAGEQPAVQSSDVTGGNTYVSVAGIEA